MHGRSGGMSGGGVGVGASHASFANVGGVAAVNRNGLNGVNGINGMNSMNGLNSVVNPLNRGPGPRPGPHPVQIPNRFPAISSSLGWSSYPYYNFWYPGSYFLILNPYGNAYPYSTTFPFPNNLQYYIGLQVQDSAGNVWQVVAINGSMITWALVTSALGSNIPSGTTIVTSNNGSVGGAVSRAVNSPINNPLNSLSNSVGSFNSSLSM